jgi:hypothetical protein
VVERGRRRAITFASDVHTTDALAGNFYEAMARLSASASAKAVTKDTSGPLTAPRWRVPCGSPVFGGSSASGCDKGSAGTRPGWRMVIRHPAFVR